MINNNHRNGVLIGAYSYFFILSIIGIQLFFFSKELIINDSAIKTSNINIKKFDNTNHNTLAWLISFPMSGANDIIDFIQRSTNRTTATNYGNAILSETGRYRRNMFDSVPVYEGHFNGPFLFTRHLDIPDHIVPVLSYCGGYCIDCYPGKYAKMPIKDFIKKCVKGIRFKADKVGPNGPIGQGVSYETYYDPKLVSKAVVVVRNPFNVIQDRFITFSHEFEGLDYRNHEWLTRYHINSDGFQAYCNNQKRKFIHQEVLYFDKNIFEESLDAPCYADIYRYVNWYNLAFESLEYLDIEYIVIHYEDFEFDLTNPFDKTNEVLEFFGFNPSTKYTPSFDPSDDRGFLSKKDRNLLMKLIQSLASPTTKLVIHRYLL